ncbi:MAG: transposase [Spirochaetaceae bacterium]|nr:transposase [Spirochaetaceae bacterium]
MSGLIFLRPLSIYVLTRGIAGAGLRDCCATRVYPPYQESRARKQHNPEYKARRWIVESAHSWMNRFRKIPVRFEKLEGLGLLMLA